VTSRPASALTWAAREVGKAPFARIHVDEDYNNTLLSLHE
jgi:hypothetical protein